MAIRKITRGTSYDLTVSYAESGVAQSIVGDTLFLTVKSVQSDTDLSDASAVLKQTITVPNNASAIAGNYTFTLDYPDTLLTPGIYHADVIIKRVSNNNRYPLALEKWKITPTPTNRAS